MEIPDRPPRHPWQAARNRRQRYACDELLTTCGVPPTMDDITRTLAWIRLAYPSADMDAVQIGTHVFPSGWLNPRG